MIKETMKEKGIVYEKHYAGFDESLPGLLDGAGFAQTLREDTRKIIIKPNLVEALQPPITTPVALVEVLVNYIKNTAPEREIIIAEGCGAKDYDTDFVFKELGYCDLAGRANIELLDLNYAPLVELQKNTCRRWPKFYLPKILFEALLISVPVLKAHSLASVTLTMKNMMGAAPPRHYQQGGHWKKASFHNRVHEAVYDLNQYRTPDFTVLDATVGMAVAHLWGPTCDPEPKILAAGYDPVAIDVYGSKLLKRNWREIDYLKMANGTLGVAEPLEVVTIA